MDKKNIKLIVAYDGGSYHGWQRQKNGISVQETIEEMIRLMVKEPTKLIASGRTDSGVHARGQVCNFLTSSGISPSSIKKGLNSLLPDDILIKRAEYVPPDFHSRYGALGKTYEYRILNREDPDIFMRGYVWHIHTPLDKDKVSECLPMLLGTHDFSAFMSSGSGINNPVRTITKVRLQQYDGGLVSFIIEADGFLRHMARNIVGTLADVGLKKIDPDGFNQILQSRDSRLAGIKAPAQGLFLMNVRY